jgi:hypothetical protein
VAFQHTSGDDFETEPGYEGYFTGDLFRKDNIPDRIKVNIAHILQRGNRTRLNVSSNGKVSVCNWLQD